MNDIPWGSIYLENEVQDWILRLSERDYGRVDFYFELLASRGPLLSEPHTKQLAGKLRELRFHLGNEAIRVTYWIASGRRIIMLTVFKKSRNREAAQVMRARRAQWVCQGNHEHSMGRGAE